MSTCSKGVGCYAVIKVVGCFFRHRVVAIEKFNSFFLTREVTRPQRIEWYDSCLAIKLYCLLLGETESIECANRVGDVSEVISESEDWPVLVNRTEICILGVRKLSIPYELRTNRGVGSRLNCEIGFIRSREVPVAPVCLIISGAERKLFLSPDFVESYVLICKTNVPLCNCTMIACDPFYKESALCELVRKECLVYLLKCLNRVAHSAEIHPMKQRQLPCKKILRTVSSNHWVLEAT